MSTAYTHPAKEIKMDKPLLKYLTVLKYCGFTNIKFFYFEITEHVSRYPDEIIPIDPECGVDDLPDIVEISLSLGRMAQRTSITKDLIKEEGGLNLMITEIFKGVLELLETEGIKEYAVNEI